jgi:hypothetical protein
MRKKTESLPPAEETAPAAGSTRPAIPNGGGSYIRNPDGSLTQTETPDNETTLDPRVRAAIEQREG